MIILSTNPFFTALLQYFWINQLITVYDAVSMVGSFLGIVLIGTSAPQKSTSQTTAESDGYLLAIFFCVTAAVFQSFIYVATSRMKSIHNLIISFYLGVVCGLLSTSVMLIQFIIDGRIPFQGIGLVPWFELLGAGVTNFLGINFLTIAFQ
jgi:drug/metabolite transporter (DMT)-like permease